MLDGAGNWPGYTTWKNSVMTGQTRIPNNFCAYDHVDPQRKEGNNRCRENGTRRPVMAMSPGCSIPNSYPVHIFQEFNVYCSIKKTIMWKKGEAVKISDGWPPDGEGGRE